MQTPGKTLAGWAMKSGAWSEADLELLRKCYPHMHTRDVATLLDRSIDSLHVAARKRGIVKTPEAKAKIHSDSAVPNSGQFRPKHGHANPTDTTYRCWAQMKARCTDPKNKNFANYGARGIYFAPEWADFENFLRDMGVRPAGLTLGRIDNDGPYAAWNCRWETMKEQQNNRRSNRVIDALGKSQTLQQWSEEIGVRPDTLACRLAAGWPIDLALTTKTKQITRWIRPAQP